MTPDRKAHPEEHPRPAAQVRLSDERLADRLAHSQPEPGEAEDELLELRSALRSYRTESLHWAERRSATQPSLSSLAGRGRRWSGPWIDAVPRWTLAAIAVATVAAGAARLGTTHPEDRRQTAAVAASVQAQAPSAEGALAEDNRLLSSIDQALSYHGSSPVDVSELRGGQRLDHDGKSARETD